MQRNYSLNNLLMFLFAVLVGILLGLGLIYLTKQKNNYYAVYLTDGQLYFGKLSTFPKLQLNDPVFLRIDNQGNVSLQRFKDAVWMPKGQIYLNRSSILFTAPISENSPLISILEGKQQPVQQSNQQSNLYQTTSSQPVLPQQISGATSTQ